MRAQLPGRGSDVALHAVALLGLCLRVTPAAAAAAAAAQARGRGSRASTTCTAARNPVLFPSASYSVCSMRSPPASKNVGWP